MNKETLIGAVGDISDRFIDEYAAATSPRAIKKRRVRRVLKYTLIPAACLCFAACVVMPLLYVIFGGSHAADPGWNNYHADNVAPGEYGDLLISRLPNGKVGSEASLFHDRDGRYDREKWNVLEYSTAYNAPGVFDFVSIYAYFPNNFVATDDPENGYKSPNGGVYDHFSSSGTTMEVNGVTVKYADLSDNENYSRGYLSGTYTDEEFDALDAEILERLKKNGIADRLGKEELAINIAHSKSEWCRFYTAGFEYDGVFYVLTVRTRYRADPLEYYLGILIPEKTD